MRLVAVNMIKMYIDASESGEGRMTVSGVDKLSVDDTDLWHTACKKLGIQHRHTDTNGGFCVKIVRASGEITLPELLVLKNLLEHNDDFKSDVKVAGVQLDDAGSRLTERALFRINTIPSEERLSLCVARERASNNLWDRRGELWGINSVYETRLKQALIGPPVFYDPINKSIYCENQCVLANGSKDGGEWKSTLCDYAQGPSTVQFDVNVGGDSEYPTPSCAIAALGCAYGLQVSDVTNSEHESAAMALVAGGGVPGAWVCYTPNSPSTVSLFMMGDEWHRDAELPEGLKVGWASDGWGSVYIHKKEGQFESVADVEGCLASINAAAAAYLENRPETELEPKEEKKDNNSMTKPVSEGSIPASNLVKTVVASAAKTAAITAVQQRMVDASVVGLTKLGVPQEALDIPAVRTALNILLPLVVAGLANAGALSALGVPELTSKKLGLVAAQAAATSGALALAPAVLSVLTDLTPFLNDVELPGGSVEQLEGDNEG